MTSARAWSSSGRSSSAVEDIAFVRFGGEDAVRHQLVQRIVEAYGAYLSGPAGARRLAGTTPSRRTETSWPTCPTCRRTCAAVAATLIATGVADGRLRRASWTSGGSASSTAPIARDAPTDVLSFPIDGAGPAPARASSVTSSSVHGTPTTWSRRPFTACCISAGTTTRPTTAGCSPYRRAFRARSNDRRGGRRPPAPASSVSPGAPTSANRRLSTPSSVRRWRSSPIGRRPREGEPRRRHRPRGWLATCTRPAAQRPRDVLTERMQRRVEHELDGSDAVVFVVNGEDGPGDRFIARHLLSAHPEVPVIWCVNKVDRLDRPGTAEVLAGGRARGGGRGVPGVRQARDGRRHPGDASGS